MSWGDVIIITPTFFKTPVIIGRKKHCPLQTQNVGVSNCESMYLRTITPTLLGCNSRYTPISR